MGSKSKEVTAAGVKMNSQQSLQCTKCQFQTQSKWHFGRHMGKNHKDKVALEVAAPAEVDSGSWSKVVDEAGKPRESLQRSSSRAKSTSGGGQWPA